MSRIFSRLAFSSISDPQSCSRLSVAGIGKTINLLAAILTLLSVTHAEGRTFTGRTGKTVEAEIVSVSLANSSVRLRFQNGTEQDIPFANISDADQAYVRQWTPQSTPIATPNTSTSIGGRPATSSLPSREPAAPVGAPGETITIEFPELAKDRKGAVAACKVRLPTQYDPSKPMPLLLWFAGGDGSNNPSEGLKLVDGNTFAVAAMPYPENAPTPQYALGQGKMPVIRDFHMAMLPKLIAKLPNVDPKLRFAGGFSNGAHVVGTYMADAEREFIEYFNGFIIIEGGCTRTDAKKKLRNHFAYVAWGDAPGNTEGFMKGVISSLKDGKLQTTSRVMSGVGHGFPDTERAKVREWIEKVAIPGLTSLKKS